MRKLILLSVIGMTACAAPDPVFQRAVSNLQPKDRLYCEMQAQQAYASMSGRSMLDLEASAMHNRIMGQCLTLMVQQQAVDHSAAPAQNSDSAEALVARHIATYGQAPVKSCMYEANYAGGSNDDKAMTYLTCVGKLRPI